MFHNSTALVALSKRENTTKFQKTLSINDYYFKADDFDFPLGNIQMLGKSQGPMFAGDAPAFAPGFALDQMARHSVDFWLTTEDLPDPNNRVSLNKKGEITLDYTFNNQEPTKRLRAEAPVDVEAGRLPSPPDPQQTVSGKDDSDRRGRSPGWHLSFR